MRKKPRDFRKRVSEGMVAHHMRRKARLRTLSGAQEEIFRIQAKSRLLKKALRAFVDGYPDREWEGLLHEEGCVGVRHRKEERDYAVCRCDGDFKTTLVKVVLR